MCKIIEEYGDERAAEALQKGIEIGEKKNKIKNAKILLSDGKYTAEQISRLFNISISDFSN